MNAKSLQLFANELRALHLPVKAIHPRTRDTDAEVELTERVSVSFSGDYATVMHSDEAGEEFAFMKMRSLQSRAEILADIRAALAIVRSALAD